MGNSFLGLSYETWGGVLLAGVIIPILWWLIKKLLDYIRNRKPASLVLKNIVNNSESCHIFVRDMEVELHQDPRLNNAAHWPLLDRAPRRLGGKIEGRGINIPTVWADSDARAVSDVLNVLGQTGKRNNIRLVKRSEDDGERNCHIIIVGGQDQNAQHFYSSMENVFYKMTDTHILDPQTGTIIDMDANYRYGLILKAKNPYKTTGSQGVAILIGGFGVLGTVAAAYYLRTRINQIAKTFGSRNFGIVIRCRADNPPEAVERIHELDKPKLTKMKRFISWLQ